MLIMWNLSWAICLMFFLHSCGQKTDKNNEDFSPPKYSKETSALMHRLTELNGSFLFGHQDATAYGVGWNYSDSAPKCDIKDVCGDYPAVYGWDLGHIEVGHVANLDTVRFSLMKQLIREADARGGVITLSWHLDNPVSGKNSWDPSSAVADILPGQKEYQKYMLWVNRLASFIGDLKDADGARIPVLFRPFHEMSGNWFWWGKGNCTPGEYKKLWIETVRLLREVHKLDNLIMVYSSDKVDNSDEYLTWYPGNEWVDIIGLDFYDRDGSVENFTIPLRRSLTMLKDIGNNMGKIYALTETGYESIPEKQWWTERLLPGIEDSGIAWVLLWRNDRPSHHYAPYPKHISAADFIKFHDNPVTLFEQDWLSIH